jgi:hypothetical protein
MSVYAIDISLKRVDKTEKIDMNWRLLTSDDHPVPPYSATPTVMQV